MHNNSLLLFKKHCLELFDSQKSVLEIGPDKFPSSFQVLTSGRHKTWDTVDIYKSDKLTFQAQNTTKFPIPDDSYDIVMAANVIEHVQKPWLWIKEVTRVCKPGGIVITINPVSWPYHEAPIDCFRYYPEGMRSIYEEGPLKVVKLEMENADYDLKSFPRIVQGAEKPFPKWKLLFMQITGYPFEYALDILTIGKK